MLDQTRLREDYSVLRRIQKPLVVFAADPETDKLMVFTSDLDIGVSVCGVYKTIRERIPYMYSIKAHVPIDDACE